MRKAILRVPPEVIAEFTEELLETGFDNEIVGVTRHDEIEIEVMYEKDQADLVEELEEHLQGLIDELDSQEDEDDC